MTDSSTVSRTAARIRREFLEFFEERHGHRAVPSSPVVPHDDPTLLFTNAGMNQFKDVFLGRGSRGYVRAVNSQKCIRAGGKHNDLEDVGKDTYHHTFFEMLGNWSFGDYFKEEAIGWAWELLTTVWGLDPNRLYVTVFAGDERDGLEPDTESEAIWKQYVPPERLSRWDKKDNFWEMGESGPCGPCSEIHYDGRSDAERAERDGGDLVNREHADVIEIWNLVFIQFNRDEDGVLTPLPAQHVDTGMGFERIVRVLQNRRSNYDTDLWEPIFAAIQQHTGARPYGGGFDDPADVAYRVIADHVRCLTVAISDGCPPGNDGRAYVLRRILRRAVRHAHQTLGVEGTLLCDLVPSVVASLASAFPDLGANPQRIADIIRDEEESFLRTLDRGIALFDRAAAESGGRGGVVSAEHAFGLHDTYGFPIDLTRVMAEERGMTVDEPGYERLMEAARERSRRGGATRAEITLTPDAIESLQKLHIKPTRTDSVAAGRPLSATVKAIWNGRDFDDRTHVGDAVAVILDHTNHYAEAGGQVGDHGMLLNDVPDIGTAPGRGYSGSTPSGDGRFRVTDTQAVAGYVLHLGRVVGGSIRVGDKVMATVDLGRRRPTMANHTATHLLNHALRTVIGEDVEQRGSLVDADRLRFDFTCAHAMGHEQVGQVESLVNGAIRRALPVYAELAPLEAAKTIRGVRAVFGERYPDPVRVVSIGQPVSTLLANPDRPEWHEYSVEFCGGTHLARSDEAKSFVIVQEQALAAGIRRIQALTGAAAVAAELAATELESRLVETESGDDHALIDGFDELVAQLDHLSISAATKYRLSTRLEKLRDRVKTIRKQQQGAERSDVVDQARAIADRAVGPVIVEVVDGAGKETLLSAMDVIRARHGDAAAMLFAPDEEAGKVAIAAVVPPDLVKKGLKAGDWVREAATVCGGGGGGRPDMAQAGGKDPSKVPDAVTAARVRRRKAGVKREQRRVFLRRLAAGAGVVVGGPAGLGLALTGCRRPPAPPATAKAAVDSKGEPVFKISLAQWSLNRALFSGSIEAIDFPRLAREDYGIEAVEYVNSFFKNKAEDEAYLADLDRRCGDHGVRSLLIMVDGEGALGDPDAGKRRQAVTQHHRWVTAAKRLGCHAIRVNAQSSGTPDEQRTLAADGLRSLTEFAATHELDVIVENHGGLSSNGAWLASVMREVDHPRCGTLPDFGNFRIEGDTWYDRYQGVEELMPHARAVSAKSNEFDEQGNEVHTDYRRMLKIVLDAGYRGYVGIEYEGSSLPEPEGIRATKRLLERVREELGRGVRTGMNSESHQQDEPEDDRRAEARDDPHRRLRHDEIFTLAREAEQHDQDTGDHVLRIRFLVKQIADEVGHPDAEELGYDSMLHDVGKLQIPVEILKKPGRLTDEERRVMESHTVLGEAYLAGRSMLAAARIARGHHECWDGTGYPDALRGEDIPLEVRITAAADVLDALVAERCYKDAWPYREALEQVRRLAGTMLDPAVVAALERCDEAGTLKAVFA